MIFTIQEDSQMIKDFIDGLNQLRLAGRLFDGRLYTDDGKSFPVHRAIMATCSSYFQTLFLTPLVGNGDEAPGGRTHITVPGVSAEVLEVIIEYAYTRMTKIKPSIGQEILIAADQFNIQGMVKDCTDFLIGEMTVENCVGIWEMSRQFCIRYLEFEALQFITRELLRLGNLSKEFFDLQAESVVELLSRDEMNVPSECTVWKSILLWIDFDAVHRVQYLPQLLSTVRLSLVSGDAVMRKIRSHPYVQNSVDSKLIVSKALIFANGLTMNSENRRSNLMKARLPHTIMFCIGGWSGHLPTDAIEVYDPRIRVWKKISSIDSLGPRAYHKCLSIGDCLYIMGGTDGTECFNNCRKLDLTTKNWLQIAPMITRRCYLSAVVLDSDIYVMGGFDGFERLTSVERYDVAQNQWSHVCSMAQRRSDAGAATVKERIIIAGGFDGNDYLNTVEMYNKDDDTWTEVTPMHSARSGVSFITFEGLCYALGGYNGSYRLNSCEVYDPKTDEWGPAPNMTRGRSNFASQVLDDSIFVCGGFDGMSTIDNVEKLDIKKRLWSTQVNLNVERSALSLTTVDLKSLPKNIYDYIPKERYFSYRHCIPQNKSYGKPKKPTLKRRCGSL